MDLDFFITCQYIEKRSPVPKIIMILFFNVILCNVSIYLDAYGSWPAVLMVLSLLPFDRPNLVNCVILNARALLFCLASP